MDNQNIFLIIYTILVIGVRSDFARQFLFSIFPAAGEDALRKLHCEDNAQDYAIVAQALETVGMADMAKRSFSTLSGGEQQRVILARALAQQTPCLILDEPTNHLDITYQLELMDIVQGLGRTVVAAIHDLNIAAMYCTRLFVMEKGQLVASGTPEEVLTPELIRQVYGVKAKVFRDEAGILRIQYYPEGRK